MKVVGITGGTGTGKTTALFVLHEMGAYIVDCDDLYHDLLETSEEMLAAINARFPGTVTDGILDRKMLGGSVFGDETSLIALNSITHPFVEREILKSMEYEKKSGREIFAIDAIALLEGGIVGLCDVVVGIIAPVETRVRRLMAREGISEEYARLRISAQHDDSYYINNCTAVLYNDGDRAMFEARCREYFEDFLAKS